MPDSVIGQLAGKAFIIEPDGTIIIAAEDSVLRDGDIFISALFGHSDKSQKAVVIDIHQDRVLLQEQESLTELMIPDNLDVLDILTALEEGQDPTQLEGVEAAAGNAAGNAADSSSIAAQAIIESGSTSHVYAYAGFTTQTPTDFGLTLQQLESIDRVFIAETEDPIASLTGDNTIEEGTSASYTISISNAVDTDTRVSVVISHKTSESGDITPITREVIIPAGQTSATFSIDTIDDVFDETADSDTFTVSISDIKTGDAEQNIAIPPSIETNILDEDALNQSQNSDAPSLTLSGSETVIEGDSASYTLTLSHAPTSDVTITVVISRSTAEGDDVSESTREITIPAGGNSATFSIDTMDDVFDESNDDDVFSVTVSNVEGGGFERLPSLPNSVDTIINDGDASAPTLTLTGDSSVNEGESASYTITLSEPPSTDMTITVTVGHRTSENGDIPPVTRNILIPAGSVSTTFSVDTDNDVYDESNDGDVFSVTVNGVSGGGFEQKPELPPSFDTTLNDGTADAPTLTLTGDSNVTEGGNANYTLTLSHAPSSDFTVTIVVGHQTSENGDITPETRDVVIAAGTTSTTFIVATADDVFDETNDVDVFDVSVGNTSGGGFEQQPTAPTSIATTIDEDTDSSDKPTLTLTGDNEVTEGEEASYTLTISEAPTSDLTVTVVVGHKTSEDGDVTPVTRSVVIAAGTTSTDFTVATLDDSILETTDDDVFEVSVTGTAGGGFEVLPDNPAAVETTINEDTTSTDKPTLTLTGDSEVVEGAEASYTLTISEVPTTDLTVNVVVGHKTSEDGDVTPVTRDVVVAAGTTSTDFTVATLDDSILETTDDDVFEVSVTGTSGGGFEVLPDNPSAVETTINEDTTSTDKPTLTLTGDAEVIEGAEASYTLSISEAPTSDLTVTVVVGHKTSEDGDVTPITRSVVIAAGTTSTDFTVTTLDDSILETSDDDAFEVSVTGSTGGGFEVLPDNPAAVETTINEDTTSTDKPTLTLTGDAEVTEGEEAFYTLTISEVPTTDLTVTVVVGHKTSEDGDVTPITRSVVIAAGTTSTDFTVATLDDSILETNDDDVFEVSVTGTSGGGFEVLPDNPAAVETTINEDTTSTDKPTLTLTGDTEVTEGKEASYTLTISEAPTTDLTVTVVVGHKTSEDGDVTPVTRSVVIAAGTTSTDFTVATLDDSILETNDDDVFEVSVTGTAGGGFEVLPDNPAAVETTINEDTTSTDKPTLTLTGDNEMTEGEEASYTLTISEAPTSDLTVTVVVGHKTSEDGDVTPVTRNVVIAAGTTSTDFTVATLDDSILETNDDDVFEVSVTGTSGGGFEVLPDNPSAVETTINEDTTSTDKPTLTLTGDAEVTEGEEASYTLTISEAPTSDLTVTVVVGHKTSEDGDVTPVTRSVVIAAGTTSTDFTVATLDDSILETNDDDVFEVSVTGTAGGGFEVLPDNPAAVETTINEDTTSTDKPTLTLTGDAEVTEGEEASYTLSISEAPTTDLTVTVIVGHKTSEDGDVTPVTRSVVIAAGTTSTDFTVATLDDSILETSDDDVFEVSVTGSTGGGFEVLPDNPSAVETTINEDTTSTDKPTLTLTGDSEVTEGEDASYTLTISEAPTTDLTVTVVVGHKTSEDGDVTPVTRSVVIAAGTTSTDFTVATLDDSILETTDDDVFEVSVTGTSGGGFEVLPDNPASVETTINEDTTSTDKPTLTLAGDSEVTEGEEASYTLTISEAPTVDLTVTVVVGHKTSEDGDVTPITRSVVIAAGTTSTDFTVATLDDSILETNDDDVFEVSVTGTSGGGFEVLPDNPASVETTINEDTTSTDKPTLTLTGDAEVTEGEEASYTLTISEAPTTDLTVTVVVGHKTSEDGDVTPITRSVVIAAGTTSTDFTVATLDDSILETNDEDVFEVSVTGTSGGGFEVLPDNPAAVETTINEDTTSTDKPTLTLTGDSEVTEGEDASYTLIISEAPTVDLTVTVVVGHKTSEDGDVTPVTRNVVIVAGTTSTDFTVATLDDSILETNDDDAFEVSVTGTSGGGFEVLPDNPAAVETTINEDTTSTDKPTLTLTGDADVTEGEEASYTLSINEAPTTDLTVTVVVGHKTSEDGDVTPVTRSVVIAAGTTSTNFTVATLDDSILETTDDDVFEVSVTGSTGGGFEVLPDNPAAVETTINEDTTSTDKPTLTLTGDEEVTEGEEASYTLTISEAPTVDLTVTVVVGHKTSEDGDVTPVTRNVVIAAGTTSTDFTVATLDDSILETNDDDVFEVSVTGTAGGGFEVLPDNPSAVETIINEDTTSTDKPTLTLTGDAEVTEGKEASYTLTISEAPTSDLTVTVVVGHKTSEDGDVTPVTRNVVIAAGTTSTDFTVETLDDSILETNDEDVFEVSVTGTSGGGFEVLPDNPAAVETTINEDTTSTDKPTLTLTGDAEVTEGEEASYTLTINEAPTVDLTVTVVVGHKTSEDGDVTPVTRSVVIAAGTTSTDFTVETLDDSILETNDDDVFEVSVTGTSGGGFEVLPDNPAAVETTINEDTTSTDKPTLTLTGDSEVTEGEEASYTLTISEAPTSDLTVTVVVGHKTSEDGDVTPVTRSVVIAAGTTSTDFTVATLDDSILETNDDDVFEVSVTGTAGGGFEVLPDNPSAVETTINEDTTSTDKPTLTLTGDTEVTEGEEASYTLTISEAPTSDLTVTVVVGHKTSEDGDVIPVTRDVVISAGTTSTDFTVATLDDSILETNDDDVFEVSVTGTSGGGFEVLPDNPAAVETTINDGDVDAPTLTLTGDSSVEEGSSASYTVSISEAPTSDMTISIVVGHISSENGDVTPETRNVTILAGTTAATFEVSTSNDLIDESADADVFSVSVDGISGGGFEKQPEAPAAVQTTINDGTADAPSLTLTGDSSVDEGETASYTLTVSTAPVSDMNITVVIGHKTSESGDVTPITRTVTIAAGTTSQSFTVATTEDTLNESADNDVFTVSVSNVSGGGFEAQPALPDSIETTIDDDDISSLIEDVGPQSVSGVLQVIDDSDNALTFANTTVVGEYGSLTLVDGDWTYTLYQNAQSLNDGQEVNENITLTATDGTQQVISIAVTGTQDAAVVTGNFTGSVDADGFSINSDETNNVHADSGAVTSTTNAAWTTTSTTINGVPYVIATQWGAGTVSTFLSRVNDDGTLTETDRITYNPNDGTVVTSSGGDITADLTALGIEARSLGNGLTQSNASNIDGQPTLFVTSQNSSSLTAWNISDTGTLSINGGITDINSDDNQSFIRENVTFEGADGTDYIYVTRPGTDGISKLTYDAQTGEMVNTNEFIFGGESVSSIDVFTNDNYDSFLAAASNDAVRIFSIDQSTGALTLVDTATVAQGTSNSVNFYHTSDGRTYAIYANNSSNQATIFEVSSTGELTQTDTVNGAGHYFASAGYIDGEPVYVMPNATQGVDLYTIGQDGKLVFQTNVADIENDWTPPVIVQTEDGSYYLVDSDGEDNGIVSTTKLTFGNSESSNTDDSSVTVSGIIGISDIDSNDNPSFENTTIQGTYGSLTLIDGTWTYTLDKDKSANIPDDETTQDIFTLTATDGTVQSIVIDVTGHQPAIDLSLQGENTGSIIVDLSPQAASPGFVEDSSTGDVAFTLDAYTADLVDDADLSDSLETRIQITSLPNDGVLYYFNDSGTKIAVALNQILPDDTAFVFEPDRSSVTFAASDITSSTQTTIVKDGITVSGGTFSGSKPDSSSTITPANIAWEFQAGESGIGVGDDRELTSTLNEVMVIEFTGSSDITSSNIVVSSAYGNFSDTRPANGQAHAIVYRDGQIVGEYDYPNLWEASGGDGIATINIADPDGFDEIRFYVTATVNSNLNVTSISAEGVNTTETEFSYKAINSLNNESETATVTLGETINDQVSVTTPSKATGSLSVVGASGLAAVFANTTETGLYGEIVLVDGMWTYTVDPTRLDAIPDNQSVQDVITLTATDGTTTDVTIVIGESEGAITNFYTSIADDSLSDIINMNNVTFLGSANDDLIQGDDDEDAILAREGNDRIFGGDGNDTIDLGFGDDFVSGGRGNDILAGGEGEDTFAYFSGDEGTGSAPAVDHISDFNTQEDTLNLTDLLQGETTSTVDQYLNIVDDSQGHAILNISKNGDGVVNQQVVFDNLSVDDMASAYQIDTSNMTAAQISTSVIDAMLMQSKLVID
ncbi:immunoglobulin-like domain-containing protein [Enterovibrio norvegicus]|uniref:immunoglobulin-like domain-containing protein n=2 Tax=Enterovibrio norvegicus TaxID=188144 RepID=UPI000C82683C|nr:immunoglobulin-like domain-containing protein [Enterovibrio norvegicus]PMN65206.1 hypothetical protein BCT27_07180 [Enterovibrio norvegicus]